MKSKTNRSIPNLRMTGRNISYGAFFFHAGTCLAANTMVTNYLSRSEHHVAVLSRTRSGRNYFLVRTVYLYSSWTKRDVKIAGYWPSSNSIPSGQYRSILLACAANHSAVFGSSCLPAREAYHTINICINQFITLH